MRIKLTIKPKNRNAIIPFNYNYYLSTAIYRWIEKSSPEYSKFLHESGFSLEGTNRRFKHFCFSNLIVPQRKVINSNLMILSDRIEWYVGIPIDETLKHFVIGIFEKQEFYIERKDNIFFINMVEALPEPEWKSKMKFRMISPLTISVPEERNGKFIPHYLRPDDSRLNDALRKNIINKFLSLNDKNSHQSGNSIYKERLEFSCMLDDKFIQDRGGAEKISKLITIKENQTSETKVRGFMCPITLEGNIELIKLAYDSGLGEKGSLGFGMIEQTI